MEIGALGGFGGVSAELVARRLAVVHLKPDCIMRQLARDAILYLRDHDFRVGAFRLGCPSRDLLWLMHGQSLDWTVDDWFHNIRLYQFGPTLTLLLYYEKEAGIPSAQGRLCEIKGGALPSLFGSDTLRATLGARTRIFNLVHCADDFEGAVAEALCYFDPATIGASCATQGLEPSEIVNEIAAHAYGDNYDCDLAALWAAWTRRIRHACQGPTSATAVSAEAVIARLGAPDADMLDLRALLMLMERLQVYSSQLERYMFESYLLYRGSASELLPAGTQT